MFSTWLLFASAYSSKTPVNFSRFAFNSGEGKTTTQKKDTKYKLVAYRTENLYRREYPQAPTYPG